MMGKMLKSYKRLFDELGKKDPLGFYFIYGEEEFMKKEFMSTLMKGALKDENRAFNLDIFYGDDFDRITFDDRVSSYPLFSARRVVVLRNFDALSLKNKDFVLQKIENISGSLILVIESPSGKLDNARLRSLKKLAEKRGVAFHFGYLTDEETLMRVKSKLKKAGLQIEPEALDALVESVGTQLMDLSNEIEKIISISGGGSTVTIPTVKNVVGKYRTENIFSFLDELGSRRIDRILSGLNRLLDSGEEPVFILAMLIRRVLYLMQLNTEAAPKRSSSMSTEKPFSSQEAISPFLRNKLAAQSRKFRFSELELTLDNLIWADFKLKTSQIKPGILIEEALIASNLGKILAVSSS